MTENEYQDLDGLALADLLQKKAVSSPELMEHAVALPRTRGAALNAIRYEKYDDALHWARQCRHQGPFHGIPFLARPTGLGSGRLPVRLGANLFTRTSFTFAASTTQRFEAAGLIPVPRTSVPEFCMAPTTEAVANGG